MTAGFTSWGRIPKASHAAVRRMHWRHDPIPVDLGELVLPYGLGRSYGDICLNDGQVLLHTTALDHFIAFDQRSGELHCEAGVTLKDILNLVVPMNWFLPVTPGTKFVTIGGVIANDVHGKNHHCAGSFGNHVIRFTLRRSTGETLQCSRTENPELFSATIGGLGLTGLIVSAVIRLIRIASPFLESEKIPMRNIDEFFALSNASESGFNYTVAWIDSTAKGHQLGKGIFMRGNHAGSKPSSPTPGKPGDSIGVPVDMPNFILNRWSVAAFNRLYYALQSRSRGAALEHYDPFFYPLDSITNWNRVYGRRGFYQYQCVIPTREAEALKDILRLTARTGGGSFLSVLKVFGAIRSQGVISFPRPGATLALDFPNCGGGTLSLLERLDEIVLAAGGALYPAKDARMSGEMFKKSFPRWMEFAEYIDPAFSSSFWRRVTS